MLSKFEPGKTKLGWIGVGVMGSSMCGHLMAKGFGVTIYNRSRGRKLVHQRFYP